MDEESKLIETQLSSNVLKRVQFKLFDRLRTSLIVSWRMWPDRGDGKTSREPIGRCRYHGNRRSLESSSIASAAIAQEESWRFQGSSDATRQISSFTFDIIRNFITNSHVTVLPLQHETMKFQRCQFSPARKMESWGRSHRWPMIAFFLCRVWTNISSHTCTTFQSSSHSILSRLCACVCALLISNQSACLVSILFLSTGAMFVPFWLLLQASANPLDFPWNTFRPGELRCSEWFPVELRCREVHQEVERWVRGVGPHYHSGH